MQPAFAELEHELEAASFEIEAEHDSAYRTARQQYLRQLLTDDRQPQHVRGWIQQELNRLAQVQRAEQAGQRAPGGSARHLRGVPGLDVGHKLGKHNQHDPRNFRLEDARFNRARPGLSRGLGLFQKYRESETEFEAALNEAAEGEITTRSGQATVNWIGPYSVAGAIQAGRGKKGLYVISRSGNTVDSGKADVQDLATRLAQHFEYPLRHGENLNVYRIRLGIIRSARAVNLAEGTVTRSLAKRGLIPETRQSLATGRATRVPNTAAFRTPPQQGVRLIHTGRMPAGLRRFTTRRGGRAVQTIGPGQTFEFLPPHEANFESALHEAAEQMDAGAVVDHAREASRALPPDMKQDIVLRARMLWQMGGAYFSRFLTVLAGLYAQNPAGWQQALLTNRAGAAQQLAALAGRAAGLPARGAPGQPGLSDAQVRDFHRRQQARGFQPGRNRQTGRYRELELELEDASRELEGAESEGAESFYTKVTPIPGIGNKEGHEILTRLAMIGLPLTAAEQGAILLGVIRPDRGGQSYWNFPGAALGSLRAAAQAAHSLRPTPATSTPAAMGLIQARFSTLHLQAMHAADRITALAWLGEALHLLQDSFSSAHVERAGGIGRITKIRAFFIRFGWPPRSTAPDEHQAPSDDRDDVYLNGTLRPEARAAVAASQAFLVMALRHLPTPLSPGNQTELFTFIRTYLSM